MSKNNSPEKVSGNENEEEEVKSYKIQQKLIVFFIVITKYKGTK